MRSTGRTHPSINHEFMPIHFYSNIWNEYQSLKARVLYATPVPDANLLTTYRRMMLENLHLLLPGVNHIKSVPWEEYLVRSNASLSVKRILTQTKKLLDEQGIHEYSVLSAEQKVKWTQRSSFIKVENLLYLGNGGEKDKTPRTIQGAQPEFIVLVGPWIMAVQDAVKRCWKFSGSKKQNQPIVFSSGLNGEDIGEWASLHQNFPLKPRMMSGSLMLPVAVPF